MVSEVPAYKLVFLGDSGVGKTSIISRFVSNSFNDFSISDIDYVCKTVNIDNKALRLQLWDKPSWSGRRALLKYYIKNSPIVLIVFDVTNKESFNSAKVWVETADEVKMETRTNVIKVLVGNKIDNFEERCVNWEEGAAKATELGAIYIEVSAKLGVNIKTFFHQIAWLLMTGEYDTVQPYKYYKWED